MSPQKSPRERREYQKNYYEKNKEKSHANSRNWWKRNKDRHWAWTADWRIKNIAYSAVLAARNRCRKSGMEFKLDRQWAEETYTGYCVLTGIEFVLNKPRGVYSPSLDRIDNNIGYVPDNCRFILSGLNSFKGIGTDEDMFDVIDKLLTYHKLKTKEERKQG